MEDLVKLFPFTDKAEMQANYDDDLEQLNVTKNKYLRNKIPQFTDDQIQELKKSIKRQQILKKRQY